ncbi:DUF742 domain-containing protein [Nocardia sp. BMG111209]|uniref:DUF742 domain-containing protein n=1 Tax=Nocardia sp. BMG111209 TaxID=1160137 RepID=UPI000372AC2E|nr:DUF742 domain-containing protein [Nocardia sp. BMG111209]
MSHGDDEAWFDEEAGPLVRLYAVTRGRGRTTRADLNMLTRVVDSRLPVRMRRTEPEYLAIVELCRSPQSIAEVSAHVRLPLAMTKVLVGDLVEDGRLVARAPATTGAGADVALLQAILNGIRSL